MRKYEIKDLSFIYCSLIILWLLVIIGGCANTKKQMNSQTPLQIGVVNDISGSVVTNGVPALQISQIDNIISVLKKRGGTMAFGLIDENSFEPLNRLTVLPVVGRLDERAQYNTQNQGAIKQFREAIEPKLNSKRNAKTTDFYGAMRRFSLFFDEPNFANAEKVMIVVSDGIDSISKHKAIKDPLPDGIKVFSIGMENDISKRLFGEDATVYESIDSAVSTLNSTPNTKGEPKYASDTSQPEHTR